MDHGGGARAFIFLAVLIAATALMVHFLAHQ
jgi:hypothetical protein